MSGGTTIRRIRVERLVKAQQRVAETCASLTGMEGSKRAARILAQVRGDLNFLVNTSTDDEIRAANHILTWRDCDRYGLIDIPRRRRS